MLGNNQKALNIQLCEASQLRNQSSLRNNQIQTFYFLNVLIGYQRKIKNKNKKPKNLTENKKDMAKKARTPISLKSQHVKPHFN